MALQKSTVPINFSKGTDTKTDSKQVQIGKFLALQNSVFDKLGALTKRNGFPLLTTLPNTDQTTLSTYGSNLIATGSNLYTYNGENKTWYNKGVIQPVSLTTTMLVRNNYSQSTQDIAIASTGLACVTYVANSIAYYRIVDSTTGQQVVSETALESTAANPRVFQLGAYFIITYAATIAAAPHLRYLAIPVLMPTSPLTPVDISTSLSSISTGGYDGYVANNTLYLAWASGSTTMLVTSLSSTLIVRTPTVVLASTATRVSVTVDTSEPLPTVWVSWWDSGTTNGYTAAFSNTLVLILAKTQIINTISITEITSAATDGVLTVVYQTQNTYSFSSVRSDYLSKLTVTEAGAVSSTTVMVRSVGLASKLFVDPATDVTYVLVVYGGTTSQSTFFLVDLNGVVYMRLAPTNAGGYKSSQILPSVTYQNSQFHIPYLVNDFLAAVNKGTNLPSGTPTSAIYTQVGIGLASFSINSSGQYSSEIANDLHLTGGQLWMFDSVKPVEHGFHVYPENFNATAVNSGGSITTQQYYYVFCYEWTDNQGNLHRSAPSIPLGLLPSTGSSNTVTLHVPTLRLTQKVAPNPVRIVGYRWSAAQQVYYQFTSLTSPTLNDTTADSVTITDTLADSSILGNTLLYTSGGVVENIAAPASTVSCLFKQRLFLVDAEDQNLLWYSKQVVQATPVEMSDLFTIYVAPTSGSQGSTGSITALGAMDDKLIIFKRDAIYYITGTGPDNTGANNDFSEPVFVTSSVGCTNPKSVVVTPMGIMFQSDKGIWLLGRDLQTSYVGAPVEAYNALTVQSAQVIPGTNQVRFVLQGTSNTTLMYDYYVDQWGTFSNISAISATLYEGMQTYLNARGEVYQELENSYLDGSRPVLLSFTTSWISLAGLQGFERFYFALLLGTYRTPFKLAVHLAYDYNANKNQTIIVTPDNYSPAWGGESVWGGGGVWGGPDNTFEARVFPEQQKCSTFRISIEEIYDSSYGVPAGAGLSLSGLNLVVGTKKGYRTQKAGRSFG